MPLVLLRFHWVFVIVLYHEASFRGCSASRCGWDIAIATVSCDTSKDDDKYCNRNNSDDVSSICGERSPRVA